MMMISLGCFRPRLLKSRLKKREVESPETDLYTNGVRVAMKKEEHQKNGAAFWKRLTSFVRLWRWERRKASLYHYVYINVLRPFLVQGVLLFCTVRWMRHDRNECHVLNFFSWKINKKKCLHITWCVWPMGGGKEKRSVHKFLADAKFFFWFWQVFFNSFLSLWWIV